MHATKRKTPLHCAAVSDNHSSDVLEVWHGAPTPLYVCGYHESRPDVMREIYAAAAVSA